MRSKVKKEKKKKGEKISKYSSLIFVSVPPYMLVLTVTFVSQPSDMNV